MLTIKIQIKYSSYLEQLLFFPHLSTNNACIHCSVLKLMKREHFKQQALKMLLYFIHK